MTSSAVTIATVYGSEEEPSWTFNANSAKINSVTPIFLNFIQFYMKTGAIIENLIKKILWSRFYVIAKNRNF